MDNEVKRIAEGAKIKFEGERQRYTVRASNDRFLLLTKPFNAQKTYIYTIVDLKREVRGACNLIFGLPHDAETQEGARQILDELESGDMEVSYRNYVPLKPEEIKALRTYLEQKQ